MTASGLGVANNATATTPYDADFYRSHEEGSLRSARAVVPIVMDLIHGCAQAHAAAPLLKVGQGRLGIETAQRHARNAELEGGWVREKSFAEDLEGVST